MMNEMKKNELNKTELQESEMKETELQETEIENIAGGWGDYRGLDYIKNNRYKND